MARFEGSDRYQFQSWPVKVWRRRILVWAWFSAMWVFLVHYRRVRRSWEDLLDRTGDSLWKIHWSCAKGQAHFDMGWWYTSEEVRERLQVH